MNILICKYCHWYATIHGDWNRSATRMHVNRWCKHLQKEWIGIECGNDNDTLGVTAVKFEDRHLIRRQGSR